MSAPTIDNDHVTGFRDAMVQSGIAPRQSIVPDGRLHRFDVDGDHKGSRSGFYVLHLDGRPAGAFGCWKRGIKQNWHTNGAPLDDFELAKLAREVEAERKKREREQDKKHAEAAETAAELLATYSPAAPDHPYLVRKGVQPHGAAADGQGCLVLSMADAAGKIWSLQTINDRGEKRFMPGGRKKGCVFWLGDPGDRIVIAEGFATGASIHEATGLPVAVAFDCGNLEPVAVAIRARWPQAQIVVAADDDRQTEGNPGLTKAGAAAATVGGTVAVPAFSGTGTGTDFNDLHAAEGIEAVATIVLEAFPKIEVEIEVEVEAEPAASQETPAQPDWEVKLAAAINELNNRYFVAATGGRSVIGSLVRDDALDRDRLVFSREQDVRLQYRHRHYIVGHTKKGDPIWRGLGDAWLEDWRRRTYDRIALLPGEDAPPNVFNLWRGWGVEMQPGGWPTIRQHLFEVICSSNAEQFNYLLGWLGYSVQHPDRQAEVAVVLRGLKGTGKGTLGQMLLRIFGDHGLHISHSRHLVGHFNAHLADTLFLFLDEAFWGGDKQGEGVLKALITERVLTIEPKGVDPFTMPNRLKILMASNSDWVVPATADERRYFVLDVSECRKGDHDYFDALYAAIDGDELRAFLHHLRSRDLTDFRLRAVPHTDGLNRQKLVSADSVTAFWFDCLNEAAIVGTDEPSWPADVVTQVLHAAYLDHAREHGERHPITDARMIARLAELWGSCRTKRYRPEKPFTTPDGRAIARPQRYALDTLEAHRAAFLEAMNIVDHVWPVVDHER